MGIPYSLINFPPGDIYPRPYLSTTAITYVSAVCITYGAHFFSCLSSPVSFDICIYICSYPCSYPTMCATPDLHNLGNISERINLGLPANRKNCAVTICSECATKAPAKGGSVQTGGFAKDQAIFDNALQPRTQSGGEGNAGFQSGFPTVTWAGRCYKTRHKVG